MSLLEKIKYIQDNDINTFKLYIFRTPQNGFSFVLEEIIDISPYPYSAFSLPVGNPAYHNNVHDFMIHLFSGHKADYQEINVDIFLTIFDNLSELYFTYDQLIPNLISRFRHIRLNNKYVSDQEQSFFTWLGFSEFYPSRHISIDKKGYLPVYS